jgi:hypothetical protein
MLLFLAALLASAGAQSEMSNPAALPTRSLHTPDEIAPAVLPYLACLYASRGLPLLRGTDGRPISTGEQGEGSDCSVVRSRAQEEALKLVKGKQLPDKTSPESFVEGTLEEMDNYVASLPPPIGQGDKGHSPDVGTQLMIEDEVLPAYLKYNSCLRRKVKEVPLTAENAVSKFTDALEACRQVRVSSIKEAADALVKKGWDEEAREKAAKNTFAKADESWATLGRRVRDGLLQKEGASKSPMQSGKSQ